MKTFLIFHVVGYTKWEQTVRGQEMADKVVFRLIGTNYEDVLERAKKLVKRDQWILAEVVEYRENVENTN